MVILYESLLYTIHYKFTNNSTKHHICTVVNAATEGIAFKKEKRKKKKEKYSMTENYQVLIAYSSSRSIIQKATMLWIFFLVICTR